MNIHMPRWGHSHAQKAAGDAEHPHHHHPAFQNMRRLEGGIDLFAIALVVLFALAFWGSIWGLPGAFLSTPLTVMVMVICAQFDGARWIAVLLSADGDPHQLKEIKPDQPPDKPEPH